jgi:hypothetical protein
MKWCVTLLGVAMSAGALVGQPAKPLYENSFEQAEVGKVPEEFLVYEGAWAVREEGGNKFLELPGAPLETYAVLFGPTEKENLAVAVRAFSTSKGRRAPTFAVGLNGMGGYRLQVSPAKKQIELFRGETLKATAPFDWQSGQWTLLRLQVRKAGEAAWRIEGKAWTQGSPEPNTWLISLEEKEAPPAGRASVWGSPFAGTPIRFDDLSVSAVTD